MIAVQFKTGYSRRKKKEAFYIKLEKTFGDINLIYINDLSCDSNAKVDNNNRIRRRWWTVMYLKMLIK